MKTGSLFVAGMFLLLFTVATTNAQELATPVTKVLPTKGKGVIKLLVVDNPGKNVMVNFYNEDGLIASDAIQGHAAHGFSKRYDLSRVIPRNFWMEVKTENATFTYAIQRSGSGILAELRESKHTYPIVAAR